MKTCGQCIYWQKVKSIKDYGDCVVELPPWVSVEMDNLDFTLSKGNDMAAECHYYREEQEEDLRGRIEELEKKLYNAITQQELDRHIVDGYDRG